jgi:hypothetical protein
MNFEKKTGAMTTAKKKIKQSLKNLEGQHAAASRLSKEMGFEVTRAMVRVWKKKGYDLHDIEKLKARLMESERPPAGLRSKTADTPDEPMSGDLEQQLATLQRDLITASDYETARRIKTKIAGLKELHRTQVEMGQFIPVTESMDAGARAATASKAAWEAIEDDLPPMLEGLTAAQMKKQLRDYARAKCFELANIFEKS